MKIWTKTIAATAETEKETRATDSEAGPGPAARAAAFEGMVERYHRDVCHLVYRMTPNRADAQR